MIKLLSILTLAILLTACGGGGSQPRPNPPAPPAPPVASPEPTITTPQARVKPTPYPVPAFDVTPYLHEQGGKVVDVTIQPGEDVGAVLNRVDSELQGPGKIVVRGGGDIRTQIVTSHDVDKIGGELRCETKTLEGCWLIKDNSKVEGFNGATIYEPTHFAGSPAITVFQTHSSAKNNYASSQNVTVKGVKIIGRQAKTDGGVRQTISFGNCKNCAAIENDLSGIASIGIQFGGGAAQGNHAENALAYKNKLRRFAAAAIALVNVKGAIVTENDIADPGRKPGEPGGISAIDIESNNTDDCVKDLKIFNNRIGYGNAAFFSIGNGILGQNVYKTACSGGLLIANNIIDGYEGREGLEASNSWGLSGGLYFVGSWEGGLVVNNIVTRALQPSVSLYGVSGLTLQDNWMISGGGGGSPGIYLAGSSNNSFIRNRLFDDPSIRPGSTATHINCDAASGVNKVANLEDGGTNCKQ